MPLERRFQTGHLVLKLLRPATGLACLAVGHVRLQRVGAGHLKERNHAAQLWYPSLREGFQGSQIRELHLERL